MEDEKLRFFKALADSNRLKILGLLAQENLSVEQLAEILELRPSTVSHHLSKLAEVGLVSAEVSSYYNIYKLERKSLEETARQILSSETLPELAADIDIDAYDRKVIRDFTSEDGKLVTIPAQRKKLEAILKYIICRFEPEVIYEEKQVNEILAEFHADYSTLRRELVGAGLLKRSKSGSQYWRPEG
jgi:DNA-binding HxlR family transcriptional regulator